VEDEPQAEIRKIAGRIAASSFLECMANYFICTRRMPGPSSDI